MNSASQRYSRMVLILLLILFITMVNGTAKVTAQIDGAETTNLIDWYYGTVFGTGAYSVDGKTVYQVRVPFSFTMVPAQNHKWSVRLLVPVSIGLYDFDLSKIFEEDISEKVGTLAILPGVEFLVPVRENWSLKPFAHIGGGKEFSSGGSALIYSLGLRSSMNWFRKRTEFILGGEIRFAGYRTSENLTSGLARFGIGGNFISPLNLKVKDRELNWGIQVVYYRYFDDFDSFVSGKKKIDHFEITDELDVGFTIGTYQPLEILGFTMDRIGVGFLVGDHIKGVRLITGFPF